MRNITIILTLAAVTALAQFGPAPAGGRGRAPVLPGSFTLLVVERAPAAR